MTGISANDLGCKGVKRETYNPPSSTPHPRETRVGEGRERENNRGGGGGTMNKLMLKSLPTTSYQITT